MATCRLLVFMRRFAADSVVNATATFDTADLSGEMMKKAGAGGDQERSPRLYDTDADVSSAMKKMMLTSTQISGASMSHSAGHSSKIVDS